MAERERQAGYDPARYWPERFAAEGLSYCGAGGERGGELQADAFWCALGPELAVSQPRGVHGAPNLLDFGCGSGRFLRRLADLGFAYHGVDLVAGAVKAAAELAARERIQATLWTGPTGLPLAYPPGYFEAIVAVTVLQHVPEPMIGPTCAELERVLAHGCRLFLIEDANPEGREPAPHMAFRSAADYATLLGLKLLRCESISAERPRSHYLAVFER